MKGRISEVFDSIQGEGLYLGEKQLFVRFFGCNLACKFCDTKAECFIEYNPQELFQELRPYCDYADYHSLSFTGGEPLLQKDFLKEILQITHRHGLRNYLETNGTLPAALEEVIDYLHFLAVDLKLPSSTGLGNFWQEHRRFLEIASKKEVFLKTVICQTTKEDDLREGIKLIRKIDSSIMLVLQPDSGEEQIRLREKLESFKDICTQEDIISCVIPQMHKVAGVR